MRLLSLLPIFLCMPAFYNVDDSLFRAPNVHFTSSAPSSGQSGELIDTAGYQHWSGNNSVPVRFTTFVARSSEDWNRLWSNIGMEAPGRYPDDKIAIGIMLGSRPTDGYNVRVTSLRKLASGLAVVYLETKPSNPQSARKTVTSPWVVMLAPKTEGSVRFIPQSMAGY